jgi:hypothetical protein
MREVKSEAPGFHKRSGLPDVISEHFTEGPVKNVSGGVVTLDRLSALDVDGENAWFAGKLKTLGGAF